MSKRVICFCAIFLIGFVGGTTWEALRPGEPVYQGKDLSAWVAGYHGGVVESAAAERAVRQAGTNGIPILLRMVRERDSNLKVWFMGIVRKQGLVRLELLPAWVRNVDGAAGFRSLGAEGKAAVPALIEVYNQNFSRASRNAAAEALAGIGPSAKAAVPSLLRQTTNTDYSVRGMAVEALGGIHAEPEVVVPVLERALQDSDTRVRLLAARSLGMFGGEAKQAVPELSNLLESGDRLLEGVAQAALHKIGPEETVSTLVNW